MHFEAEQFLTFVRNAYPDFFQNKVILDVGAADLNGNNRKLFTNCQYNANDVMQSPNVTIVCPTNKLSFPDHTFDTIISSECFEHDMEYKTSITNIVRMLKPGGLFTFTCASTGRPEHGTRRTSPQDSLTCWINNDKWADYYKNLTAKDIKDIIPCNDVFLVYAFYYNSVSKDLYFYGIKKGVDEAHTYKRERYELYCNNITDTTWTETNENNLTAVLNKYNTDKNEGFHNYGKYYERYLSPFRYQPIRYLEIGVYQGANLAAMREYFPQASHIVGIDINPDTKKYEQPSKNIFVEIGSQSDKQFLQDVHKKHGGFDVILDDGSHILNDMIASFETLFPLLNNGGVYIVEDTICIRQNMSYFHNLTMYLNRWRYDSTVNQDHCVDPAKIYIHSNNPLEYSIGDIVFTNSAIIIHKDVKQHWISS